MYRLTRWAHERLAPLESHDVVTAAMRRTGSADLGDLEFSERLEVLCRSLQSEAGLTLAGRRAARAWCVDALARRIERDRGTTTTSVATGTGGPPGGRPTPGPPGIFVTGLAADLNAAVAAALTDGVGTDREPGAGGERDAAAVSDGRPTAVDDEWWLRRDIASMDVEHHWHVPAFAEVFDDADLAPAYRHLLAEPSRHALVGGEPRRVGWSVQHLERLDTVAALAPDDVLVIVDVDIEVAATRTAAASITARRRHSDSVDDAAVARYWGWRYRRLADRGEEQAGGLRGAVARVTAEELASAPEDAVRRIVEPLGGSRDAMSGSDSTVRRRMAIDALRGAAARWTA